MSYVQDTSPPRTETPDMTGGTGNGGSFPANEAARPTSADTPLKRSLDADISPGQISRSDDAPFIWAELRKHAHQFGQLEKEVATNTRLLEATNKELITLQCANAGFEARLDGAHRNLMGAVDNSTQQLREAINNSAAHVDLKAQGRHEPLTAAVTLVQRDLVAAVGDISTLKTDQASNKKTLAFLSKFGAVFVAAAAVVFPLLWSFAVHPSLVKSVSDAVKAELDKEKLQNARIDALERENAELRAGARRR